MAQLLLALAVPGSMPANLAEALALVDQRLVEWASNSAAYDALLREVFGGAGTDPGLGQQAAGSLRSTIAGSGLSIQLEVLGGDRMPGLNGGYTTSAPGGGERIYLSGSWLPTASSAQIEAVLLEELGHAIDTRLNGAADSRGDEGEIFSALLRGQEPTTASRSKNDQRTLMLSGHAVAIEAADTIAPVALTTAPAFAAPETNPFGLTRVGFYASPELVDIDGDGDLDAFIGNVYGNSLFFRNTAVAGSSSPAFAAASTNPFGLADVGAYAGPDFVDIDGDGDLDAFIGRASAIPSSSATTPLPAAPALPSRAQKPIPSAWLLWALPPAPSWWISTATAISMPSSEIPLATPSSSAKSPAPAAPTPHSTRPKPIPSAWRMWARVH